MIDIRESVSLPDLLLIFKYVINYYIFKYYYCYFLYIITNNIKTVLLHRKNFEQQSLREIQEHASIIIKI